VAWRVYLDASALVKRYAPETGTPVLNHLFRRVAARDMLCLTLGTLEVFAIFVRKKNANVISLTAFNQAVTDFRAEIIDSAELTKLSATDPLVLAAFPHVQAHSLNSNDAVILCSALEAAVALRGRGDDLLLLTSDQRLQRAAGAEGLAVFNPEAQTEADLDVLLGP
jgi:predicted nucleic acid-binding protein